MTISAFKTCKVWFSLNPSMCNSGFYRIPGSNILSSLNIFSSLLIFPDSSFSREFLLSFSLFSLPFLHNPSPPFIMEFSGLPGEPLVPLFCSFANRVCLVPVVSVSPFSVSSHSFLLSVLILLKASGWLSSLGVLRYALLGIPTSGAFYFSFSFLFGRNPVLPFLKIVCYHSSSLSWFPEASSVCAMRGR